MKHDSQMYKSIVAVWGRRGRFEGVALVGQSHPSCAADAKKHDVRDKRSSHLSNEVTVALF